MTAPYLIGTADSNANSATLTIAVATATAAGDAIVVAAANSGTTAVSGVTDSKGNTYTSETSTASQISTSVWVANGPTTALTTSDTITVTYAATNTNVKAAVAGGVTGYSAVDVTPAPASNGGSINPSIASGTLAQAAEVIWFIFANGNGGGSPTGFTNCTSLGTASGNSAEFLTLAYDVVSATTSVTGSCTIATTKWAALCVSLKALAGPVPYLSQNSGMF